MRFRDACILASFFCFLLIQICTCSRNHLSNHNESPKKSRDAAGSILSSIPRYLLYDVNAPEGFNLRRDVYMRMAIFVKTLADFGDWYLVLPPWPHLYHWKSPMSQSRIPWSYFFDIESLQKFAPVIEASQFFQEYGNRSLDAVYILQNFKDTWTENFKWEEKWDFEDCWSKNNYFRNDIGLYEGDFWGYDNVTASLLKCVSFQGQVKLLKDFVAIDNNRAVKIDHAEIALHNHFGNPQYWECRRSMRFAKKLVEVAEKFRKIWLNSTNESDETERPSDWTEEKPKRDTVGGPFFCAHLRRNDFLWGRPNLVPDFEHAAKQIKKYHKLFPDIKKLFIATDASEEEFPKMKNAFEDFEVIQFDPAFEEILEFKDGGVAIIDQIICSHARLFIGTCESTFSFRIQEEREILGFNPETTFNCFCGRNETNCTQPSKWLIANN